MIKQWIIFLLTTLAIVFTCYSFVGRIGLLVGLALSLALLLILRALNENQLLHKQKARPLMGRDAWGLLSTLSQICKPLGCTPPEIHLKEEAAPIVYSLVADRETGVILLSTGLVKKMSPDEMQVILAYQVLSLLERRSLVMRLWTSLLHGLLMVGFYLDCFFFGIEQDFPKRTLFSGAAKFSTDFFSRTMSLSSRHLSRDERVAQVIGQPQRVAQTLWKLENLTQSLHSSKPFCGEHLLIVNPLTTRTKNTYFLSHPSLEKRIRHLVGQYPL